MAEIVQVTTTVDSRPEAERLATLLVEERLAACAQIEGPIESIYRWDGRVTRATEWRCVIKTAKPVAELLRIRLLSEHPYDVPEVLVQPTGADEQYAHWVVAQTDAPSAPERSSTGENNE